MKKLVVTTTKIRELSNADLSEVVGGHPLTGIPAIPLAPQPRPSRMGR